VISRSIPARCARGGKRREADRGARLKHGEFRHFLLRLTVPTDPAQQTSDDQEFLMNTQDIVETWRREAMKEGERKLLLRQLRRRFGAEVDGETERRVAAAPAEQVEVWADRVLSASTLAEVLAD
jgi:hypothetical protein